MKSGKSKTIKSLETYLKQIKTIPLLSPEEEEKLIIKAKKGNQYAKGKIIESHLKLVVKIAKNYAKKGIHINDLIQQGNIGLVRAIKNFDPFKGYKFSSFSRKWIKGEIYDAFKKNRAFSLSARQIKARQKYIKVLEALSKNLGKSPHIETIAKKMNISKKKALEINEWIKPEKVILENVSTPLKSESVHKKIAYEILNKYMSSAINSLPKKEREILNLRFGIKNGYPLTLKEVGEKVGLSREGVRKKEMKALEKLRKYK